MKTLLVAIMTLCLLAVSACAEKANMPSVANVAPQQVLEAVQQSSPAASAPKIRNAGFEGDYSEDTGLLSSCTRLM